MTEANLRPSWPSYQLHMYCLHKSDKVCTQFQKKTTIDFATLGRTYIGHSSTRLIHNLMKSCALTSVVKDAWYCLYRLQSSMGYARNSRKTTMHFGSLVWNPNPMCQTSESMLDPAFIGYRVQREVCTHF